MDILKISGFIVVLCAMALPCQAMDVNRKTAEGGVHERLERAVKKPGKPVSQTVRNEPSYSGRPALSPGERKKRKIVSRMVQLTMLSPEICRKNHCKDHRLLSKEVEKLKASYPEFFHRMAGSPYYDEVKRKNSQDLADGKYDDECNSCGAALWMIRELLETPEGRASMLEMIETLRTNGENR